MAEQKKYKSTCSYCGVGCGVVVERDAKGRISLAGDPAHPANQGRLCSKGMNLHHVVMNTDDRLLYPEMRYSRNAPRERVSWENALTRAAAVFSSLIHKYGPDSVGFYVSGQLLTEEYYIINKLTKGFIGTANIDTNSRLCMSSAVVAYKKALGEDSVPVSYEDIDECEVFLIAGANPAWCHPILFRRIEDRKATHPDTKIIVVDPRRTDSCEQADLHLQIAPGTDVTLYNAIARELIETACIDIRFIREHTDGFEELKAKVFERGIDEAAAICAVPGADIRRAAAMIGNAKSFLTLWAMGLNQSAIGVNKNLSLINLNLITGQIGKPGSGPFSLTGQPNAMGGREVGGLASMLAAHRDLGRADHRAEVAAHWGVPAQRIPDRPGLSAVEMFEALRSDRLKAIWIVCTNPMVSLPDSTMVAEALRKARFVVVQDISRGSDTLEFADLVLPAAGWLEKEGTMTNSDRRVSYLPAVVDPPGEALPDAEIFARFAERMGYGESFSYFQPGGPGAAAIYREHCELTRGTNLDVAGLDYERLRDASVQWPAPAADHPGTPRLFTDGRFFTENQRAKIFSCDDRNTSELTDLDYPLVLTTGRIRDQWHTMTRTGKVRRLGMHIKSPVLEVHPDDAAAKGIVAGDLVAISGRRGSIRLRAKLSESIKPGVVFAPMHWGKILQKDDVRTNNITNPLFDPVSKEPDFKFSAVNIEKFEQAPRHIVVIGAGAASFAFVEAYRRENRTDRITILSREPDSYYNRILLPEYLGGRRAFEDLRLADVDFAHSHRLAIHGDTEARQIDREARQVVAADGQVFKYDLLVLATGSRARQHPRLGPADPLARIYTLRNRQDAERIRDTAGPAVLIIGGGLLGIELADALRLADPDRKVMLVHRSARLMSRQLDATAAELLATRLRGANTDRDIELYLNDEVIGVFRTGENYTAYLASGKRLICSAIVCALGTEPETGLAREAGLKTNFGVIVDEYMRTSDPAIYAIGEAIEFQHRTYGTTLAAGDQAQVLAGVLAGDPTAYYRGSIDLNILKVDGIPLVSMGQIEASAPPAAREETVVLSDPARGIYKKFIIRDERLVGCILLGDTEDLARLRELHESQLELGEERERLVGGANAGRPAPRGALVCSCNRVGEGNLRDAIAGQGIADLDSLCRVTGAGTGCGSCVSEVRRFLKRETEPAAAAMAVGL